MDQQQQPPPQQQPPQAFFSQMMGGPSHLPGALPGARGGLEGLMGAMNLNPHPMGGLISDQRGPAMPQSAFQQQQQATNEETARGIMEAVGSNRPAAEGAGGAGGRQTPFDASDFPSLMDSSGSGAGAGAGASASGGRFGPLGSQSSSVGFGAGGSGAPPRDPYTSLQFGMLRHKHGGSQNGEFSIQNEEFPALGGGPRGATAANSAGKKAAAGGGGQDEGAGAGAVSNNAANTNSSGSGNNSNSSLLPCGQVMGRQSMGGMGMGMGMGVGGGAQEEAQQPPQQQQAAQAQAAADASDDKAEGGKVQKIAGLADEKFGLLGLLNVIRMSNADLTTLALGMDLTTLGLNLNSPGSLYKSFTSPWSDNPQGLPAEPDFKVPQCYLQVPSMLQVSRRSSHTKKPKKEANTPFTTHTLHHSLSLFLSQNDVVCVCCEGR